MKPYYFRLQTIPVWLKMSFNPNMLEVWRDDGEDKEQLS